MRGNALVPGIVVLDETSVIRVRANMSTTGTVAIGKGVVLVGIVKVAGTATPIGTAAGIGAKSGIGMAPIVIATETGGEMGAIGEMVTVAGDTARIDVMVMVGTGTVGEMLGGGTVTEIDTLTAIGIDKFVDGRTKAGLG